MNKFINKKPQFQPLTPQTIVTKKREVMLSHLIVVLSELMIESIDELVDSSKDIALADIPEHPLNQALRFCEILSNRSNEFQQIKGSNYLQDLSYRVFNVIKKNYKPVEELQLQENYGNHFDQK